MTLRDAIINVLSANGRPMRTRDIWAAIHEGKLFTSHGKTPYRTMTALITKDVMRPAGQSDFARCGFGVYGLRRRRHTKRT